MSIRKLTRTFSFDESIVVGRMERYFLQRGGQVAVSHPLMPILESLSMGSDSDRSGAFHASQIDDCHRKALFGFFGLPRRPITDPTLALKFMDGTWRHIRWQLAMLDEGVAKEVEVEVSEPSLRFVGSMDALGEDKDGEFGIEIKGWSAIPDEPLPYHLMQVHGYMLMADLERFVIVYEHKSTQSLREFLVTRNRRTIGYIKDELEMLNGWLDKERVPEMLTGCMQKKGETWTQCPYRHICPDIYEWQDMVEGES